MLLDFDSDKIYSSVWQDIIIKVLENLGLIKILWISVKFVWIAASEPL